MRHHRATIKFVPSNVTALKKALRKRYAHVRSSHADEALAASFGFKSYAAMLSVLRQVSGSARLMIQADPYLLLLRLEQFGYRDLNIEILDRLTWEGPYPDPWNSDDVENALKRRFGPIAANAQ